MWEMFARKLPHAEFNDIDIGAKIMHEGVTPEIPQDMPLAIQELMLSCWQFDPKDRPISFADICQYVFCSFFVEVHLLTDT